MDRDTNSRSEEPQRGRPQVGMEGLNNPNLQTRQSFVYCIIIFLVLLVFLYVSIKLIPFAKQPAKLDFLPRGRVAGCEDCVDTFTNVTRDDSHLDLPPSAQDRQPGAARKTFILSTQVLTLVDYNNFFPPLFDVEFSRIQFEALDMPLTADQADAVLAIGASTRPRRFIEQLIAYLRRRHTLAGWIRRNTNLWTEYDTSRLRYTEFLAEIETIDMEIRALLSRKEGHDPSAELEADQRRLLKEKETLRSEKEKSLRELRSRLQTARAHLESVRRANQDMTKRKSDLEEQLRTNRQTAQQLQSSIDAKDEEIAQTESEQEHRLRRIREISLTVSDLNNTIDQEILKQIGKEKEYLAHYESMLEVLNMMENTSDCEKKTLKDIEELKVDGAQREEIRETDQEHNLNFSGVIDFSKEAARMLNFTQKEVEKNIERIRGLNLPQKIADCRARIEALNAKDKEGKINREKIERLLLEKKELEDQVKQLENKKNRLTTEKKNIKQRKDTVDTKIDSLAKELRDLAINDSEESEAVRIISQLEEKLKTGDSGIDPLANIENELLSISRRLAELRSSKAEHSEKHRSWVEKLNSKLNEANDEKQRLAALRSKIITVNSRWSQNQELREQLVREFNEIV